MVLEMLSYEETMRLGAEQYSEPINALVQAGWQVEFTQTGGMNAALLVTLESGCAVLVTDAEDSLSWYREDQQGWGVGFWVNEERSTDPIFDGALAFQADDASDVATLLILIPRVVRAGTQELLRRQKAERSRKDA